MKTLIGAAEPPEPLRSYWTVGPGSQPLTATASATSTTSAVWISGDVWAAAGPIRTTAYVGEPVPEIEAP